jgi:hypothetical protein
MSDDSIGLSDMDREVVYGDDWTKSSQRKLIQWKFDCIRLQVKHEEAAKYAKIRRDLLTIPIIFFSGAVTLLISVGEQWETNALNLVALLVSAIVTALTSLNSLLKPTEKHEKHVCAANAYANLVRQIDYTCTLLPVKRPDVEVAYVSVTSEMDNIATTAPPLPFQSRGRELKIIS